MKNQTLFSVKLWIGSMWSQEEDGMLKRLATKLRLFGEVSSPSESFMDHIRYCTGSGEKVLFWLDKWIFY